MAILQYGAQAYIVDATDPTIIVQEVGPVYIKFLTYAGSQRLPSYGSAIRSAETFQTYIADWLFAGQSQLFTHNSNTERYFADLEGMWLPAAADVGNFDTYITSSYKLKIVFNNGYYAISSVLSMSATNSFTGYDNNGNAIGAITVGICQYSGSDTTVEGSISLLTATDVEDVFPDHGNLDKGKVHIYNGEGRAYREGVEQLTAQNTNYLFYSKIKANEKPADPYDGAGDSGPGGGGGDFDYTGDPPAGWSNTSRPAISATATGFVTIFNPNATELNSLSDYLWSSAFDINTFKKIFNDPMDLFIGLSILPMHVPVAGRKEVGIGVVGTGVYMNLVSSQYVPVDCGTVFVKNFTGSYLDYDPYTKVEIFLPFIGTRTLKADEIIGHNLHIGYWVDLLSGACTAWLDVDGVPMYQFMGQCATSIPMASGEWTDLINGIIGAVGAVASGAAAGGVGGAIAGGVAAASAVAVNDGKIQVERSGAVTSAGGLMGLQVPTLYLSSPWLHKPAAQNTFEGYPAYFTSVLGELTGFTTVEKIRLQGIPATEPELQEIETLLKGGVIL